MKTDSLFCSALLVCVSVAYAQCRRRAGIHDFLGVNTTPPCRCSEVISSSVGSGNQPLNSLSISTLQTGRIPIVNYEPGLYDELLFQRENTFGNAGGHTPLAISVANQSHPLAASKVGNHRRGRTRHDRDDQFLCSPIHCWNQRDHHCDECDRACVDEGHICIWAYEKGSHLADDNTVVLGYFD